MNKTIAAQNAPAAVGPYCQAKQCGNTLYTSGQLGLIPATGKLAEGIEGQAKQSLENLGAYFEGSRHGLLRCGQDHLPAGRHQGLRRFQRGVRQLFQGRGPRSLLLPGGRPAHGRSRGDRGHRSQVNRSFCFRRFVLRDGAPFLLRKNKHH